MPSVSFFKGVGRKTHVLLHGIVRGHSGPVHEVVRRTFAGEGTYCWVQTFTSGLGGVLLWVEEFKIVFGKSSAKIQQASVG